MSYIRKEKKERYNKALDKIYIIENSADLQYLFMAIAKKFLEKNGVNDQSINDVSGALTNCNLEMYRRVFIEHQNKKILENGDVL